MSEDAPAFQWYAADYLADGKVQLATSVQEGIYIRLLSYCWRELSIPADPQVARQLCKPDATIDDVAHVLKTFFVPSKDDGQLIHKRLEEERKKQKKNRKQRSEAGRKSGESRRLKSEQNTNGRSNARSDSVATKTNSSTSSSTSSSIATSDKEDSPSAEIPPEKPEEPKPKKPGAETWLTVYGDIWREVFGGEMPFGKFSKDFKDLERAHGKGSIPARWRNYCEANRGRGEFANSSKFAQTFGQWGDQKEFQAKPKESLAEKNRAAFEEYQRRKNGNGNGDGNVIDVEFEVRTGTEGSANGPVGSVQPGTEAGNG